MLQRLRDFREDRDISQQKMAELLNVAQTTYSDYERGKINIPLDTLRKLALFFICLRRKKAYPFGYAYIFHFYSFLPNKTNRYGTKHAMKVQSQALGITLIPRKMTPVLHQFASVQNVFHSRILSN